MYRFWLFVCYRFLNRWNLFYRHSLLIHSDDMSIAVTFCVFSSSPHPSLFTNSE